MIIIMLVKLKVNLQIRNLHQLAKNLMIHFMSAPMKWKNLLKLFKENTEETLYDVMSTDNQSDEEDFHSEDEIDNNVIDNQTTRATE